MVQILAVGMGGFVGAVSRFYLSSAVQSWFPAFRPAGTLCVNVCGCFILGCVVTIVQDRDWFSPRHQLVITHGFLGSLTTFSTFGNETLQLLRSSQPRLAFVNVAANLVLGIVAVWLGSLACATDR